MGLKDQVLCLERPQDGRSLEIIRSLLANSKVFFISNGKKIIIWICPDI